jgi:predicted kinase|tara:strand:+ start:4573 stop:5499 length:927 start_codon:yes stop_codon:yes gene_type:complete
MKLSTLILEDRNQPKVVIMAGGAGAGKSYLLNQLSLDSLEQYNPDKYVEDPDHPAHNNLSAATALTNKDVAQAIEDKSSFVWDTTASNPAKIKELVSSGYSVFMVMVYTHPIISYISNFSRERNIPSAAVFSTWRNVYQLIADYNKMLKGNLSIFVNDRGGKYDKEVEGFNLAAKNGAEGIADFLQAYNEKNDVGASTFRKPIELDSSQDQEFSKDVQGIDWDKESYGEDRAIKDAWLKAYNKNGVGPGADKLKDSLVKYRDRRSKQNQREKEVLDNIGEMLFSPVFQEKLKHSSPAEIDSNVQNFLA